MDEETKQLIINTNKNLTDQINNVFAKLREDIIKLQKQTSQLIDIGNKNQNSIEELTKKL